ncbi:unnamed protein product [Lactuca virosa]|uniref:AT-hook motif nuclear-localized protein n=1 Tax=Lactuca virosa TaxID=75947 RepID=A0AAU9M9N5_9ASTR|nr:unnamed protein product [Lactuca virosa]
MNNSAGVAFTHFIIIVSIGEDVVDKISTFSQPRTRDMCIMSGSSYLPSENDDLHNRTGGLNILLCTGDGNVIGGVIGGALVASTLVQIVVCSFVYGVGNNVNLKVNVKTESTLTYDSQEFVEKPVVVPWQTTYTKWCEKLCWIVF